MARIVKLPLTEAVCRKILKHLGLIVEMDQDVIDYLPNLDKTNLDYIFGDKIRIAVPMDGGAKFKVPIEKVLDEYEIDYDKWVAFKKDDKDRKNPTKIGKALNKQKNITAKAGGSVEEIEELLKVTDLKSQVNNPESELYIIYSRSPIDVVRMSDDPFPSSCHSRGSDYFECALGDAMNNAGIAYIITKDEYSKIKDLQAKEIILDRDRGVRGIKPLGRIRLRKLVDQNGNSQVVPTLKVYSNYGIKYDKIFKDEVTNWVKGKVNPKFDWEGVLKLVGGTYEDVNVGDMASKIYGKSIEYTNVNHDVSKFNEFVFEFDFQTEIIDKVRTDTYSLSNTSSDGEVRFLWDIIEDGDNCYITGLAKYSGGSIDGPKTIKVVTNNDPVIITFENSLSSVGNVRYKIPLDDYVQPESEEDIDDMVKYITYFILDNLDDHDATYENDWEDEYVSPIKPMLVDGIISDELLG